MRVPESSFHISVTLYEKRVAGSADDDFEVFLVKPAFVILPRTL